MFPSLAIKLLITAMSVYFLNALLTGVWKYRSMMRAPTHQAPFYVDIAHRASFQYAFACLVLIVLAYFCIWPPLVQVAAVASLLIFFTVSIATYVRLGFSGHTDNQFRERNFTTTIGMWLLIAGEIGGFLVLASGAAMGIWQA
jgi:hypothetical protein